VEKHGYITKVNGGFNMKFCSNCGTQLEDSVKFCGGCGAAQEEAATQENFTYEQPAASAQPAQSNGGFNDVIEKGKKMTGGKVWLIPVIAVGAIFVLWFVIFFFRSVVGSGAISKKGAVNAYFKAQAKRDAKAYVNATMSPSMLKAVLEEGDYDNKKELIEELEESYEEYDEWYEDYYDEKYKIKYKNIKIEDMDKCDKDDIEDLVDEIEDDTDVKVKISQMYEVEVSYKYWDSYEEDWEKVKDRELIVYKSAGNWYVMEY
jgi:uncharacterized membrane protein YvbJ